MSKYVYFENQASSCSCLRCRIIFTGPVLLHCTHDTGSLSNKNVQDELNWHCFWTHIAVRVTSRCSSESFWRHFFSHGLFSCNETFLRIMERWKDQVVCEKGHCFVTIWYCKQTWILKAFYNICSYPCLHQMGYAVAWICQLRLKNGGPIWGDIPSRPSGAMPGTLGTRATCNVWRPSCGRYGPWEGAKSWLRSEG